MACFPVPFHTWMATKRLLEPALQELATRVVRNRLAGIEGCLAGFKHVKLQITLLTLYDCLWT